MSSSNRFNYLGISAARPGGRGHTIAARLVTALPGGDKLEFTVLEPPMADIGDRIADLLIENVEHVMISPDEVGVRLFRAISVHNHQWWRVELYDSTASALGASSEPNRLAQDTGELFADLYEGKVRADGDLLEAMQELTASRGADGSPVWTMPPGDIGGKLEASILAFAARRTMRGELDLDRGGDYRE